jgi:hypothetical protein
MRLGPRFLPAVKLQAGKWEKRRKTAHVMIIDDDQDYAGAAGRPWRSAREGFQSDSATPHRRNVSFGAARPIAANFSAAIIGPNAASAPRQALTT